MDPISLLMAALTFGATEAAKAGVGEVVKEAYSKLKEILTRRLGNAPEKQVALNQFEVDQDTWEKPLRKALVDTNADKDNEAIAAARALQALGEKALGQQIYQTRFGDHATGNAVGPGASATTTYINRKD
jgi:hypothetical protein